MASHLAGNHILPTVFRRTRSGAAALAVRQHSPGGNKMIDFGDLFLYDFNASSKQNFPFPVSWAHNLTH
jgi:hypothetical protein